MVNIFVEVVEDQETGGWTAWGYEIGGTPGRFENSFLHKATVTGKTHTYHLRSHDFILDTVFARHIAIAFHRTAQKVRLNER